MSSGADNPANDPRRVGICGNKPPRLHGAVGMPRCTLPAGHDGWHHDDVMGGDWTGPDQKTELLALRRALDAVRDLAEDWKYKGEFGFGAWQEGQGPDEEGYYLDKCATQLLAALDVVGTPAPGWQCADCGWHTTSGADITWPIGGNRVDLVCPNCHPEGNFIDWPTQ